MVYAWAIARINSDEDLEEFHNELVDLLPWQDAGSESAANLESDSFMSMMNRQA